MRGLTLRGLTAIAAVLCAAAMALGQAVPSQIANVGLNNNGGPGGGGDIQIQYKANSWGQTQSKQGYIQFDLSVFPSSLVPENIQKATLELWVENGGTPGAFSVCGLGREWSSATITGENAPTCPGPSTKVEVSAEQLQNGGSFVSVDITNIVQNWYATGDNYGILLAADPPAFGRNGINIQFDSLQNDNGYPPMLDLVLQSQGSTGAQGPQGPAGAKGATGATGPQGPTGLTGATGSTGPKGPIGLTGATGATGAAGTQGPIGLTGATGPQGTIGLTGATGPQGAIGLTGANGAAGAIGPQGPIGLTGAPGTNGANGANGTNGTGFNFTGAFNSATNYNPYDVVTYGGSTYEATVAIAAGGATPDQNPSWSLMAQAGAPGTNGINGTNGATGPQGPIGLTGATGPQGAIGLTGANGAAGAIGPQGPIGLTGAPGTNGANGANGTNGTGFNFTGAFNSATNYNPYDVVTYGGSTYEATVAIAAGGTTPDQNPAWTLMAQAGTPGTNGTNGTNGAPGIQGLQGVPGLNGANGINGANGTNGAPGAQGPVGPIGPVGATGPAGTDADTNSRMVFPSFFPGNLTGTWTGGQLTLDQPITVLRIAATAKTATGASCPAAVFRFWDGTTGEDLVLTPGANWADSGQISIPFAAGATLQAMLRTGSTCASNTGADRPLLPAYSAMAG